MVVVVSDKTEFFQTLTIFNISTLSKRNKNVFLIVVATFSRWIIEEL